MSTVVSVLLTVLLLASWGVCQSGSGDVEQLESCPSFAGGLPTFTPQLDAYIEEETSLGTCTCVE